VEDWVTTIGVPAAVSLLIMREVFTFLGKRKGNGHEGRIAALIKEHGCDFRRQSRIDERLTWMEQHLSNIKDYSKKLHEMHNVKDEDGVPVWHVRTSMRKDMRRMVALLEELVRLMTEQQKKT
jgi:Asp-tRNA(Asn)/Glu-tRNA(Gln) amidotransferase C subunit